MYNRYIRSDQGTFTRISEEESHPPREESRSAPPAHQELPPAEAHTAGPPPRGEGGMIQRLLDQLHLDRVDTGDLLLLGLLFLLFREGADDEVLAALGLLLIL